MTAFLDLWLAIIVSTVAVFLASSVINTIMPWHKKDFPKVPDEDGVRRALRPFPLQPGEYMIPRCERKDMSSPEYIAKVTEGPVMIMTVFPNGPISMGKSLGGWMVFCLFVSGIVGCMTGMVLGPDASGHEVLYHAAVTAFLAYVVAVWQMSIWYGRPWSMALKTTLDGLIYALITGSIFMWLWP